MAEQSPDPVECVGDLIQQGRPGDARGVPLMNHLAQPNSCWEQPEGSTPLIRWLRLEAACCSADREMTVPRSGRRVTARNPWLSTPKHLPLGAACALERCQFVLLGGEKHRTHVFTFPLQGCFFLVTSTMESKMSVVAGMSFSIACFQVSCPAWRGRSAARMSPEVLHFRAESGVCTKGTAWFSLGGSSHSADFPWV